MRKGPQHHNSSTSIGLVVDQATKPACLLRAGVSRVDKQRGFAWVCKLET